MKRAIAALVMVVAPILAVGCASHPSAAQREIQPAIDVPTHFLVATRGGTTVEPGPGQGCRSPMIDPRDGTRIVLVRSASGRGFYQVPPARYGVRRGELLLLECETGRVMGIVKR